MANGEKTDTEESVQGKSLKPIIIYYDDGSSEQLRVPTVSATRDLAQIVSRLGELHQVENSLLTYLKYPEAAKESKTPYLIAAIGGNISFSCTQITGLASSYLDQASRLIDTYSTRKLEWRRMLFHLPQIQEIFFGELLFQYVEDEVKLVDQSYWEDDGEKEKPNEIPQNDLEAWGASLAGLLRTGKTPKGMQELCKLSRGELSAMTKFYNITEKKIHPSMDDDKDKPHSEMSKKEKSKLLEQAKQKQNSPKMLKMKEALEKKRNEIWGYKPPE